ncbi:Hypothetical predicted protein [Marmota monax]|uniref:Uncharacterized protein n=1 Tax=Marmota monax TaxID=9995 RepID=A0A5E4C1J3_MARMO|nr:Hypothetical predicted protein [Marmota monax]
MELYQDNVMELQRKLIGEQEEKLSKVGKKKKKISHTTKPLETYRKRTKDLEEELERTIHFYQGHVMYYEKKAHGNELAARSAERYLNDLRQQNAHNREELTEMESKFKLVEKDPSVPDVSNTAFGRENSPNGPSPLGRASCETSPSHSENKGPLILSSLVQEGPENPLDHPTNNERRESNCDKLTDPQRAPFDTGPLAPPWEQAHRIMIPPPGQPYSDPQCPLQSQDGCYSNYGRRPGSAELRSSTMPPLDKMDGPTSSEMELSRNEIKVNLGDSKVPDSSLPADNQGTGSGFAF